MENNNKTPWIVLACAMGVLLIVAFAISLSMIIGGLSNLASYTQTSGNPNYSSNSYDYYDDEYDDWDDEGWGYNRRHHDEYGHNYHHGYSAGTRSYDDDLIVVNPGQIYTLGELEGLYGVQKQTDKNGKYYSGIYEVGGAREMTPGTYHMDGDQEDMSHFCIFVPKQTTTGGAGYQIKAMVEYFGDYFAEFSEGELVVFTPDNDNFCMQAATDEPLDVSKPLDSGCYRVGIDIPAGTYELSIETISQDEIEYAGSTPGAYVMKNLKFDTDSITDTVEVEAGASQSVTVKDGEYLELFGVRASIQNS